MTELEPTLKELLERELRGVFGSHPIPSSAPLSRRRGLEQKYAELYQRLVAIGAKPQLRRRYRHA